MADADPSCDVSESKSCSDTTKSRAGDVVARGKGIQVTRAELEKVEAAFLEHQGIKRDAIPPERLAVLQKKLLEGLVSEALLLQVADHSKISGVEARVQAEIAKVQARYKDEAAFHAQLAKAGLTIAEIKENLGKQIRIQEALAAHVPKAADPTAGDVEKYYNEHKETFAQPAGIRASHVLTLAPRDATPAVKAQKKKAIETARARVIKGEDFAKVAKEVSDDKGSAAQGGDLGFFAQGQMVPEFERVAAKSKKDKISPVFETPYGYHFLKVTDTKPAGTVPLETVRSEIARFLTESKKAEGIQAYLKKLEQDAGITYCLAVVESPDVSPGGKT